MRFTTGNIFDFEAEALVNTVNTVGVMGKGIALQFKERFPLNYKLYAAACKKGDVQIGKMFVTPTNSMINPKWIINFPTKKHWMHKSSYIYLELGLDDLLKQIQQLNIQSIVIPPLGTGQGGLNWEKVKRIIELKLSLCKSDIIVCEPANYVKSKAIAEKTYLTKPRALILALMNQYRKLGYDISILEIQKLAYFLQRMGQSDLNLQYKKYSYGPYAHNMQHLLHELEKGYIISEKTILDSKPMDLISMSNDTLNEVDQFIETKCTATEKERLNNIKRIMTGFETPFGLELLASIDWIIHTKSNKNITTEELKQEIKQWSNRKDELFTNSHIDSAKARLNEFNRELAYV
ncbi:MAG TPA: macro domain-containing protein [Agriterribacter sp.]|nr:macro domain-containing protein [Agriterribacter sp.]HRQ50135.1 macro domain-containing protein [Agriterribacter sp.]